MRIRTTSTQKSTRTSEARRSSIKNEITDKITKRVHKKLAKVMYLLQNNKQISSSDCFDIALKIETFIQKAAENFDDYKKKVLQYISTVQKVPGMWMEINESFKNDFLEDFLMDKLSFKLKWMELSLNNFYYLIKLLIFVCFKLVSCFNVHVSKKLEVQNFGKTRFWNLWQDFGNLVVRKWRERIENSFLDSIRRKSVQIGMIWDNKMKHNFNQIRILNYPFWNLMFFFK